MLHVNWMVRGFGEGSRVMFFDNGIFDADAPSYLQADLLSEAIANCAMSAKKAKYRSAAEELWASFRPLVFSEEQGRRQQLMVGGARK